MLESNKRKQNRNSEAFTRNMSIRANAREGRGREEVEHPICQGHTGQGGNIIETNENLPEGDNRARNNNKHHSRGR